MGHFKSWALKGPFHVEDKITRFAQQVNGGDAFQRKRQTPLSANPPAPLPCLVPPNLLGLPVVNVIKLQRSRNLKHRLLV